MNEGDMIKKDNCEYLNVLSEDLYRKKNRRETWKVSNLKLFYSSKDISCSWLALCYQEMDWEPIVLSFCPNLDKYFIFRASVSPVVQ